MLVELEHGTIEASRKIVKTPKGNIIPVDQALGPIMKATHKAHEAAIDSGQRDVLEAIFLDIVTAAEKKGLETISTDDRAMRQRLVTLALEARETATESDSFPEKELSDTFKVNFAAAPTPPVFSTEQPTFDHLQRYTADRTPTFQEALIADKIGALSEGRVQEIYADADDLVEKNWLPTMGRQDALSARTNYIHEILSINGGAMSGFVMPEGMSCRLDMPETNTARPINQQPSPLKPMQVFETHAAD
jgi:hypothetical protein